jgi:hypothetical protein
MTRINLKPHGSIASKRAAALFAQGKDKKAEAEVRRALLLGESHEQVAEALALTQTQSAISRRQALKLTAGLLTAGAAASLVRLPKAQASALRFHSLLGDDPTTSSPSASPSIPGGLFLKLPSSQPAAYQLARLTPTGMVAVAGAYSGFSVVDHDGRLVNCLYDWNAGGVPQSILTVLPPSSTASTEAPTTLTAPVPQSYTSGADSFSMVAIRGTTAFCLHVLIRLAPGPVAAVDPQKANLGIQPTIVSGQCVLVAMDSVSGTILGTWEGEEIQGAMATTLLAAGDGSGALVAWSLPGRTANFALLNLQASGLVQAAAGTTGSALVPEFAATRATDWSSASSALRQVGGSTLQLFEAMSGSLELSVLPTQIVNARRPPGYKAVWTDEFGYLSNGDGRVFSTPPSSVVTTLQASLTPQTQDPGPAYEGPSLGQVWAAAYDGSLLLIDNRVGTGGIWRFSPGQSSPAQQLLPSNYFSQIVTDTSGVWLAANNPIEGTAHLV